jgi:hypothetical protein
MLRRFTSRLPAIVMAGLLTLGLSERAHANLSVSLVGGTAQNNLPGGGNGTFSFGVTAPGGFSSTGNAFGETFLASPAHMDMSTLTVSSTGAGTATLIFSMNNINSPTGLGTINELITGHIASGTGSISVAYTTYGSNSNTLFTTNPAPADGRTGTATGTATTNPLGTISASSSGTFTASAPYSLTEVLAITFSGAGSISLSSDSSANFTAVPEPSSMAIAGLGALGMIGYGLRRRKALGV